MTKEKEARSRKQEAASRKQESRSTKQETRNHTGGVASRFSCAFLLPASCFFALTAVAADVPQSQALTGYSAVAGRAERDWESKFQALPSPKRMREYMKRLSARPHHVGSPYDKENAEWILSQFKEWGLEAKIETYDVLFPTPKER